MIFGVGIGDGPWEFDHLADEADKKTRGEMLDEGLELMARLWWIEDISPWPFGWNRQGPWPIAAMNQRIRQGPPRLAEWC